jgi:hypothetical protein
MWVLTVLTETKSLLAISPFDSPEAMSASTSSSRSLSSDSCSFVAASSCARAARSFAR